MCVYVFSESLESLLKHHHQLASPAFVFALQCLLELQSRFLLTGVTIFAKLRATDGARHCLNVFCLEEVMAGIAQSRCACQDRSGEVIIMLTALRCVVTDGHHI